MSKRDWYNCQLIVVVKLTCGKERDSKKEKMGKRNKRRNEIHSKLISIMQISMFLFKLFFSPF